MSHIHTIIDTIVALALMEAIVKPVVVRITQKALEWADNHVEIIPDWLYKSSR